MNSFYDKAECSHYLNCIVDFQQKITIFGINEENYKPNKAKDKTK